MRNNEEIISQGLSSMIEHISNEYNIIKTQLIKNMP